MLHHPFNLYTMKITITSQLINAYIPYHTKKKLTRVIKQQIFVIYNKINHHLIGNIYYDILTNEIINIVEEKSICKLKLIKWKN